MLIDLPISTIQELLEQKRQRYNDLDGEMTMLGAEIKGLESAITEDKKDFTAGRPLLKQSEKTATGRFKRGESKVIIADFLKTKSPQSFSVKQLSVSTGVTYGTTIRIVKGLADQGKIKGVGGLWVWG